MKKYEIEYACVSHIGNFRSMNQDNFYCDGHTASEKGYTNGQILTGTFQKGIAGIFDGMGGEEHGEIASQIAAFGVEKCLTEENSTGADLVRYCHTVNDTIVRFTQAHDFSSMGTTAAMLSFCDKEVVLCNIGDSKIYRFDPSGEENEQMRQISFDHVSIGMPGRKPPLSQNLGIPRDELLIDPYIYSEKYSEDIIYLISSDGLTDMVSPDDIRKELVFQVVTENLQGCCETLLKKALANGGKDNITILLCKVKKGKRSAFSLFRRK